MKKTLVIALLLLALAVLCHYFYRPKTMEVRFPAPSAPPVQKVDSGCGHAVICGGIQGLEELRAVIARDQVAAALYGGFDFSTAKETTLDHDIWDFVAYRVGGHIFFTRQMRRIPKGEPVLQDAAGMTILERCGNLIRVDTLGFDVDEAPVPVDVYPPTEDPQPPTVTENPPPSLPPNSPPPPPSEPPSNPPPCCVWPTPPPNPPVSVPEPSTWILLVLGLLGLALLAKRRTPRV